MQIEFYGRGFSLAILKHCPMSNYILHHRLDIWELRSIVNVYGFIFSSTIWSSFLWPKRGQRKKRSPSFLRVTTIVNNFTWQESKLVHFHVSSNFTFNLIISITYRVAFDENRVPDLYSDASVLSDIHSVSSLLKMYFRELPNPVCTYHLYERFVEAARAQENRRLVLMRDVVQQLPPPNYRWVCSFTAIKSPICYCAWSIVPDELLFYYSEMRLKG